MDLISEEMARLLACFYVTVLLGGVVAIICAALQRIRPLGIAMGFVTAGIGVFMALVYVAVRDYDPVSVVEAMLRHPEVVTIVGAPIFLGTAAVALGILRRKRKPLLGHCPQCGYDLRGTKAAGIEGCPECGEGWKT